MTKTANYHDVTKLKQFLDSKMTDYFPLQQSSNRPPLHTGSSSDLPPLPSEPPPLPSDPPPPPPPIKSAAGRLPTKALPCFYPHHSYKLVSATVPPGETAIEYVVKVTITLSTDKDDETNITGKKNITQNSKLTDTRQSNKEKATKQIMEFTGRGSQEKLAKHEAAATALKHFKVPGCDEMVRYSVNKTDGGALSGVKDVVGCVIKMFGPAAKFGEPVFVSDVKNQTTWKCSLVVDGFTFEETGPTKKKARAAVATTCIKSIRSKEIDITLPVEKNLTFEDSLMNLLYRTYRDATSAIPKAYLRLRNVAGLYIHKIGDHSVDQSRMICVAAGAGTANKAGITGTDVHDFNAEILAIRSFRLFLFEELKKVKCGEVNSLLEESVSGMCKLKPCYQVFMIKNTPPAGDALVFSTLPKKSDTKHLLNANQQAPGSLQFHVTMIKSNRPKGVKYETDSFFVPGRNPKPEFASPSDKLTLMNIVGIQGSLASQFLEPVYIDKYVFHKSPLVNITSLERCFYKRLEDPISKCIIRRCSLSQPGIDAPYRLNKPTFERDSSVKIPTDKIYGGYAGWVSQTHPQWEILTIPQGSAMLRIPDRLVRKRAESDTEFLERKLVLAQQIECSLQPSALCKRNMLEKYQHSLANFLDIASSSSYSAYKAKAAPYKSLKLLVKQAIEDANLGTWPVKSTCPDNFST